MLSSNRAECRAVAGVGGFTTLLVTVPAAVASSWLLCLRLAFAVAHLGGHDLYAPDTCNRAFACVTGDPSPAPSEDGGGTAMEVAGTVVAVADGEAAAIADQNLAATAGTATVAVVGQVTETVAGQLATVAAERAAEVAAMSAAQSMAKGVFQEQFGRQLELQLAKGLSDAVARS